MSDPLERAQSVARGDLDPATRAWLAEGFARWLAGDDDLQQALGADTFARLRARNKALRAAADVLDQDSSTWARAGMLAAAIRRYESRIAPLLIRDPHHPLGPTDRHLQRAFASGHRVPRTQRALFDVLS